MGTIHVEIIINSSIQSVFDVLSDHAHYSDFKAIEYSELITEGVECKNGNDAVRKLKTGPITFWERISNYDDPNRFNYKIIKGEVKVGVFTFPLPFKHHVGWITVDDISEQSKGNNAAKVIWHSEIESTLPLVGNYLTKRFVLQATRAFSSILKQVKNKLE